MFLFCIKEFVVWKPREIWHSIMNVRILSLCELGGCDWLCIADWLLTMHCRWHCRWHNAQQGISGSDEVILCIQLCIALFITAFVTCKIRIKDLVQMQVKYGQNESMVVVMSYACLYMWWCWVWFSPEEEPTAPTWHVRLEMSHPEMWGGRGNSDA